MLDYYETQLKSDGLKTEKSTFTTNGQTGGTVSGKSDDGKRDGEHDHLLHPGRHAGGRHLQGKEVDSDSPAAPASGGGAPLGALRMSPRHRRPESPGQEKRDEELSVHIFSVSAGLVGVCPDPSSASSASSSGSRR